jgi:uncharacterized membrane protein
LSIFGGIILLVIGILFVAQNGFSPTLSFVVFGASLLFSVIATWSYVKFEARLNQKGILLNDKWAGFQLYLEVAEKRRLQNLKPEYFEKYLPYAMVFGLEKEWAKAFEGMEMKAPGWYSGGIFGSSACGGFSAASFGDSFSNSFTSAFTTSSGSAGGGGAGGGGGGGGGGAG